MLTTYVTMYRQLLFSQSFHYRIVSTTQPVNSVTSVQLVTMVTLQGAVEMIVRNVLVPSQNLPTSMSLVPSSHFLFYNNWVLAF